MREVLTIGSRKVQDIIEHTRGLRHADKIQTAWDKLREARGSTIEFPPGGETTAPLLDGMWTGHPCFIIGGGPSLKGFDFNRLRHERTIAINLAFYEAPFADIMFAFDWQLLDNIIGGKIDDDYLVKTGRKDRNYRGAFASFAGAKLCLDMPGHGEYPGVHFIRRAGDEGVPSSLADGIYHGGNSGYAALNLAILLGANPIYLLGFDMSGNGKGQQAWFHHGYPSNQGESVYPKFIRCFNATAAAIAARGIRAVNLNPSSRLRCFEFSEINDVLPPAKKVETDRSITAITLTGDRPLAFELCRRWMQNQSVRPGQWIIVDDGKEPTLSPDLVEWFNANMPGTVATGIRREPKPDDPRVTLDLNMKAALPYIKGDKIIIIEDDEYYAPGYIEAMSWRLDHFEVVGIGDSRYYHLPTGGYENCGNMRHASLAETAFRSSFLPKFTAIVKEGSHPRWIDDRLWRDVQESIGTASPIHFQIFFDTEPLYVGIKGLPGREGIGAGHCPGMYRRHRDDEKRSMLKRWIPKDYQVYLDVLAGMK